MEKLIGEYDVESEEGRINIQKEFEQRFHINSHNNRKMQERISGNWIYIIGLVCLLIITVLFLRRYL